MKTSSKIENINLTIPITKSNGNGLNNTIKSKRLSDLINIYDPALYCLQKSDFGFYNTKK